MGEDLVDLGSSVLEAPLCILDGKGLLILAELRLRFTTGDVIPGLIQWPTVYVNKSNTSHDVRRRGGPTPLSILRSTDVFLSSKDFSLHEVLHRLFLQNVLQSDLLSSTFFKGDLLFYSDTVFSETVGKRVSGTHGPSPDPTHCRGKSLRTGGV